TAQDDLLDRPLAEPAHRHADCQPGFASAGWTYTQAQVVFAHGADVARLSVGPRTDVPSAGLRRSFCVARRADPLAALGDDFQDGLDVFRREAALLPQQAAQLREDALALRELIVGAAQQYLVAAADELLHAQRVADLAQVLIPAAKEQDRFVAAIKSDGCFAHGLHRRWDSGWGNIPTTQKVQGE